MARRPSEADVGRVRAAELRDAAACAAVHVLSWKDTYRGLIPDAYLDALTPEDRLSAWEAWLAQPRDRSCILVIETGRHVAGFASSVAHDSLGPAWALLASIYLE